MSKPHISDSRQRKSRKYIELHRRLEMEVRDYRETKDPSRRDARLLRNADYRQRGGE